LYHPIDEINNTNTNTNDIIYSKNHIQISESDRHLLLSRFESLQQLIQSRTKKIKEVSERIQKLEIENSEMKNEISHPQ